MTDCLFFHPLAARNLYNENPVAINEYIRKSYNNNFYRYKDNIHLSCWNGIVYINRYENFNFNSFDEFRSPYEINKHLAHLLKGESLNNLADIPGSEDCMITDIKGHIVKFIHKDENYSLDEFPRHNEESYRSEVFYRRIKDYSNQKLSHMAMNVISRIVDESGLDDFLKYYGEHQSPSYKIVYYSNIFNDNLIENITINNEGKVDNAKFKNGFELKNEKISGTGILPETIRSSLIGSSANNILDHWLLKDMIVKNVQQHKSSYTVIFERPAASTLAQKYPAEIEERLSFYKKERNLNRTDSLKIYHQNVINKKIGTEYDKYK